jgi:serine/threonine protein kinase
MPSGWMGTVSNVNGNVDHVKKTFFKQESFEKEKANVQFIYTNIDNNDEFKQIIQKYTLLKRIINNSSKVELIYRKCFGQTLGYFLESLHIELSYHTIRLLISPQAPYVLRSSNSNLESLNVFLLKLHKEYNLMYYTESELIDLFIKNIAYSVLNVLMVIHSIGMSHNDLHLNNIMICESEEKRTSLVARIIDFGNASLLNIHDNKYMNGKINDLWCLRVILEMCPIYIYAQLYDVENSFSKFVDLFPKTSMVSMSEIESAKYNESAESLLKILDSSFQMGGRRKELNNKKYIKTNRTVMKNINGLNRMRKVWVRNNMDYVRVKKNENYTFKRV